jgi:preprotein translocase subunit SecG
MIALLAAGTFLGTILSILFVLICILLVFMVVITPSNEGGMAAAFGGMGSESFFGSKAASQINKFTVFLAVSFLVLALGINYANVAGSKKAAAEGAAPGGAPTETEKKMKELPPPPQQPGGPGGLPGLPPSK